MERLPENRGLLKYILLEIVTLGIYGLYLIHREAKETNLACREDGQNTRGRLGYLLLGLITVGIMYIVLASKILTLQNSVNKAYNETL